jgi:hypothetical protein
MVKSHLFMRECFGYVQKELPGSFELIGSFGWNTHSGKDDIDSFVCSHLRIEILR